MIRNLQWFVLGMVAAWTSEGIKHGEWSGVVAGFITGATGLLVLELIRRRDWRPVA